MNTTVSISIPAWLKSRTFWIALITVLIEIGNSTATNQLFPEYTTLIAWIVGCLGFISTAISAAASTVSANVTIKAQAEELKTLKTVINEMSKQVKAMTQTANNIGPVSNNS